jgi:hypothetical protein
LASLGIRRTGCWLGSPLFYAIEQLAPQCLFFAQVEEINVNARAEQSGRFTLGHTNRNKDSILASRVFGKGRSPLRLGKTGFKELLREDN